MDAVTAANDAKSSELQAILEGVYHRSLEDVSGAPADYIPELASVQPDSFGIALATSTGESHVVGDAGVEFTIQSISKAFAYCLAIELVGRKRVLKRVGVEPSGDAFNAIVLDTNTHRPFNPMVNAGAITVAGLLRDALGDGALDFILKRFSLAAGRQLSVNEAVYRSEAATGHRNRAISYLLLGAGVLAAPVEPAVDLYFKTCAISVTALDLAMMAATLANLGENPVTGEQAFDLRPIRDTLAVMFTCGMYDYSGFWAFDVGIPAKSGVGGGIIGVVNRQFGIGTYSPRLDTRGNSVRGIRALRTLSDELGLHAFDFTNAGSSLGGRFLG